MNSRRRRLSNWWRRNCKGRSRSGGRHNHPRWRGGRWWRCRVSHRRRRCRFRLNRRMNYYGTCWRSGCGRGLLLTDCV
jgi:hypothetical protein